MDAREFANKINEFITYSMRRQLSPNTIRLYSTVLSEVTNFWPGHGPRSAMTNYINSLNNKPGTIKIKLVIIKRFWNWMVKNEFCQINPTDHIEGIKCNNNRTRFLTMDEVKHLLEACSPTMRVVVSVALLTGLRRSTVLGLKWNNVDLEERKITVVTKGNKVARIPIVAQLVDVLSAYRAQSSGELLFPNKKGTGPLDNNAMIEFRNVCRSLGLEDVCFHTLRHSFASHFLKTTKNLHMLQNLLGHASLATTQRYAHIIDEEVIREMNNFNSSFML